MIAYPTPTEGGNPFFFCQNDRKGCSLDYLDGLSHFLFGFGAAGKILEGMVTTFFGKTRVKSKNVNYNLGKAVSDRDALSRDKSFFDRWIV